jgi:hypothetical protein
MAAHRELWPRARPVCSDEVSTGARRTSSGLKYLAGDLYTS